MTAQMLIYGDIQPITKNRHQDIYVKTGSDYSFAKDINSVPLMAVEFPHAAAEYPIVFAGTEEKVTPVAVIGTNENENLFVKDENWNAKYIPAFIRRYPFVFSSSDDGQTLTLCIDEEFEGCNKDGRGERLFDAEGERTQFLDTTLKFLENYQMHFARTQALCEKLVELDLLEPMQAQFKAQEENTAPRTLTGFYGISREKLKALSEQDTQGLLKTDGLELIFLHLHSLRNFGSMAEKTSAEEKVAEEA